MKKDILFSERQRFKQWWLWLILFGINGIFLFGVYKQVFLGQQFGDNPMSNLGIFIGTGFTILLTLLFFNFRLDTYIKNDGIYVRLFPFHLQFKYFSWEIITKCYVRQYAPLSEYGGWGIRFGLFDSGTAFNVSGNIGLQLEIKGNKKLLIGTHKPEEIKEVLNKINQHKT